MAAPRDPLLAKVKKAFAAAHGCDERTARRHCNKRSEQWQAFLAKMAMDGGIKAVAHQPMSEGEAAAIITVSPAMPTEQVLPPVFDHDSSSHLSEVEQMEKQNWVIWRESRKAWETALKAGDAMNAIALGHACIKAQDAYVKSQKRRMEWEQENRRVVPMSEFQALVPVLASVFALMRNMPAELAPTANRSNPEQARAAGNDWLMQRFMPAAHEVLQKLNEATGLHAAA